MEHTADTYGSTGMSYNDILVGSSKAAWSLSGGCGPAESFDPFMMSAHAIITTVSLPFILVSNFVNDALGSMQSLKLDLLKLVGMRREPAVLSAIKLQHPSVLHS